MCGYSTFKPFGHELLEELDVKLGGHAIRHDTIPNDRFLHAGDTIPFIVQWKDGNILSSGTWGATGTYNARSETMETKWPAPRWMHAVVRLDKFHEGGKTFASSEPLFAAAITDKTRNVVICTRYAAGIVEEHHHRMPFFLANQELSRYLDGAPAWELTHYVPRLELV
jgi:putative SOS response-associated peptidase YedK